MTATSNAETRLVENESDRLLNIVRESKIMTNGSQCKNEMRTDDL